MWPRSSKNAQTALWIAPPSMPGRTIEIASSSASTDCGVPLGQRRVGLADAERPRHVREARALEVLGEEIAEDGVVVVDAAVAGLVPVGRLDAVRDDHVVAAAAELCERRRSGSAEQLAGERLAVDDPATRRRLRAREQRGDRRHAGLGRLLRDADPRELEVGLAPPPVVEEPLIDDELDAVGPQPVADPEREPVGDDRTLDAERRHHLREQRREDLVGVEPVREQPVEREGLGGDELDRRDRGARCGRPRRSRRSRRAGRRPRRRGTGRRCRPEPRVEAPADGACRRSGGRLAQAL